MIKTVRTQCGRMDHGGCTLLVAVEDGGIKSIGPDPSGPLSAGHICPKARALKELHEHPDRLKTPLKRTGPKGSGQWAEISWDEALSLTAEGFDRIKEQHGGRAVAFCQGAPKGLEHFVLIRLANTFGSPNVVGPQNVCHMPREIAGMLTVGFFPVADYGRPNQAVLVWGSNLTATNEEGVICTRLLGRLAESKPPLIVVDPRRTELAARADLHLPVRPGADLPLALAFLNVIIGEKLYDREFVQNYTHGFDELAASAAACPPDEAARACGVSAEDIVSAARIFGQARPGSLQWGNGIEQNEFNFQTSRALVGLMAVCGNLDAPGGNIQTGPPPVMRLGQFVRVDLAPNRAKDMVSASHGIAPGFVIVPPELFKRAVLTDEPYPMRGAYVHVSNPVLAWSDSRETHQALSQLDFLAVTETFMTPTAALADVVFPAATQLEFDDLGHFGLAHGFVLPRAQAVDPPGSCLPPAAIINKLGRALGQKDLWWDDYRDMLTDILAPAGLTFDQLTDQGILRGSERYYKYKDKGFKTPTGKVELSLSRAPRGIAPTPSFSEPFARTSAEFPLILTGHKSRNYFCSDHRMLDSLRRREPDPLVEVHPETAGAAGIADGDGTWVETVSGRITARAKVTDAVRPGVISLVYGWWFPEKGAENMASWSESASNALTSSQTLNQPLGTPNLRGLPARLTKALHP